MERAGDQKAVWNDRLQSVGCQGTPKVREDQGAMRVMTNMIGQPEDPAAGARGFCCEPDARSFEGCKKDVPHGTPVTGERIPDKTGGWGAGEGPRII